MSMEETLRAAVEREDFPAVVELMPRFRAEMEAQGAEGVRKALAQLEELRKLARITRARIAREIQDLPQAASPYGDGGERRSTFDVRY